MGVVAPFVIPSHTAAELADMQEHPGRPAKLSVPAWIEELAGTNKAVMLCDGCARKYPAYKFGYRRQKPTMLADYCIGQCDGHHEMALCGLFMPATGVQV